MVINIDPAGVGKFRDAGVLESVVKRTLIVMALLAVTAVAAAVLYQSAAQERDYRSLIARGDAALADNRTVEAVEDYSGAIALRSDSMLAHLRRGEAYLQRGDLEGAARDFRMAAWLDPTALRPLEQWGDVLYRQRRYRRAAEAYESRLRLDDRSALIRYRLGLSYYRDGRLDAAITSLAQASALDDTLADAYYLLGVCLKEKGQRTGAIAAQEKAVAKAPGLIAAREELADLYGAAGRRGDEIQQLQVLAGLESDRVERRVAVGLAHARAGHADLAVLTLASALEQAPDQPLIYGALGRVWLDIAETRHDRPDAIGKALEALERAASAPSATSEVKTWYGHALLKDGQPEAAERVLQQATERFPVDPASFVEYAAVAEQQSHLVAARDALVTYSGLVTGDESFPARASKIGQLSLRVNDLGAAVTWLDRAAVAAPTDIRPLTLLAEAWLASGDPTRAEAVLSRGLEIDPSNAELRKVARKLRPK
jgi:tetratricopeptide (TPR) repeat protein